MSHSPLPRLSRRGLLAAGGALGLGGLLAACGESGGSGSDSAGGSGWSFKDDRGRTVTAKKRPEKIVAFVGTAAVLHDYGIECAGIFGPTTGEDGKPDAQAGDLDIDELTVLGNTWGEFNIEKYVSLKPDLLVSCMYLKDTLWYVPEEAKDKIFRLAPQAGINVAHVSLPEPLRRHEELAGALGADLKSKQATEAKARFEKASEAVRQAAKASGGLTVLAASGSADLFYVSTPQPTADLRYFQELGVNLVVPDSVDDQGFYQSLSWENAGRYHADLILLDNRASALQPKDLKSKPTWNKLPAVQAGQVLGWMSEPRYSYAGCAPLLEQLAQAIRDAKKLA